jgi:hypothetical protein
MGKHKKQQRLSRLGQQSTGLATGEGRARVEALLANGKTREAVEAAKQLLKQAPDPDAEALVVRAYQARMQALMNFDKQVR